MRRLLAGVTLFTVMTIASSASWAAVPRPPREVLAIDPVADNGDKCRLSWRRSLDDGNGANNVIRYRIYRALAGQPLEQVGIVNANGSAIYSTFVVGLTRNVAYDFGISAAGASGASPIIKVSLTPRDTTPPRSPRNVKVLDPVADTGNTAKVIFRRSLDDGGGARDVVSYRIYTRTSETQFRLLVEIPTTGATDYMYLVTGLTRGTNYGYGVSAFDGINESDPVVLWQTPTDNRAPRPARDVVLVDPPTNSGNSLRLNWRRSLDDGAGANDVVEYRILQRRAGQEYSQVGSVAATGEVTYSYLVTGLTRGLNYAIGINCIDEAGNVSKTITSWMVTTDTAAPRPVRDLVVQDVPGDDGQALNLGFRRSLDDGAGADDVVRYRIYRRLPGDTFAQTANLAADGSPTYQWNLRGLRPGQKYDIGVTAFDGIQESTMVIVSATPVDNTPPEPPTGLQVTDVADDAGTALNITFKASADDTPDDPEVTRYYIYRSTTSGGSKTEVHSIPATQAASYQWQNTGLTANKTYYYHIIAVGATGASVPSAEVAGTPLDNRPVAPPRNLVAQDRPYDNGGVIDLVWSKSADDGAGARHVASYVIFRKLANVQIEPQQIATVRATGAASYSYADNEVPIELVLYEYTVRAATATGSLSAAAGPAQAASEHNNVLVFQPPTNLTARDVPGDSGGKIQLSWNRSTSENEIGPPPPPPIFGNSVLPQGGYGGQYEFYRRTASDTYTTSPTFVVSAEGTTDPMTYVDSGLTNGKVHYYKVRYRRYNQISAFTAEASATPVVNTSAAGSGSGPAGPVTASEAGVPPPSGEPTTVDDLPSLTSPLNNGLSVELVEVPGEVAVGSELTLSAQVYSEQASVACLEVSQGLGAAVRLPATRGQGSYVARFRLPTSQYEAGSVLRVRGVVVAGQRQAVSVDREIQLVRSAQ
jgi:hypothetical protein